MLLGDVRYAWLGFTRRPVFALTILLTLALGIGANVAIFSFVSALLVRPFPFRDPDRLVRIYAWNSITKSPLSLQEVADLNERARLFEGFAAYRDSGYNYGGDYRKGDGGPAEHIIITMATSNLFQVLGVPPQIGTTWPPLSDRSRAFQIVLTHDLWTRRFRSDPTVIGKQVLMDGFPNMIMGVAPPGITFPRREGLFRCWGISSDPLSYADRHHRNALVVARLKSGISLRQGQDQIAAIGRRLARDFPDTNAHIELRLSPLRDAYLGDVRPYLLVLLGAVGLLLLIACANVSNLFLARATERKRETAIRAALGAGRGQLARPAFVEALLYSSLGGALGIGVAFLVLQLLTRMITVELPSWMEVRIDWPVLLYAVTLVVIVSLLISLLPVTRQTRHDLTLALKQGSSGSSKPSRALGSMVIAEVAMASTLLFGAGLLWQSLAHLLQVDLGFRTDHTFTFAMGLSWRKYNFERARDLQMRVLANVARIPGVSAVAMDTMMPLTPRTDETTVQLENQAVSLQERAAASPVGMHQVTANYHQFLGIRLVEGRLFNDLDHQTSPKVAIVSQRLAAHLSPGRSIVGRRVLPRDRFGPGQQEWLTVVGVVRDIKHNGPAGEWTWDLYVPYLQTGSQVSTFLVRTQLLPAGIHRQVLRAVAAVDPGEPPNDMLMMDDILDRTIWQRRLTGVVFAILAALALSLAAIGIYGVIAHSVSQRVREIGIRSALGARPAQILQMIVSQGMRFVIPGIAIGVSLGLALARALSVLLFQISPFDPATLCGAVAILLLIAGSACLIPAARAAQVDPLKALRSE